jgi:hypothetical protein
MLVVEVDNWDMEMVEEHMCLNDHIEDLEEDLVGFDMDLGEYWAGFDKDLEDYKVGFDKDWEVEAYMYLHDHNFEVVVEDIVEVDNLVVVEEGIVEDN